MTEQPADNGHGQSFIQGENRKRMPSTMESEWLSKEKQTGEDKT